MAIAVGAAIGGLAALAVTDPRPPDSSDRLNPQRHLPRPGIEVALAQPSDARVYLPLTLRDVTRDDLPDPHRVTPVPTEPATTTPSPTDEPTPTQTAEPTATATATEVPPSPTPTQVPLACQQHVPNFDFEAGPRQWTLIVTNSEQQVSRSIQHSARVPVRPASGDYLAWLGGLPSTMFRLTSDPVSIDTTDVVSASLRFNIALLTEETWDRRDDDVVAVRLGAGNRFTQVPDLRLSEETLAGNGTWRAVDEDVTSIVQAGGVRSVDLKVDTNGTQNSWFYFDDVALTTCHRAPSPPALSSGALRTAAAASRIEPCCRFTGSHLPFLGSESTTWSALASGPSSIGPLGGH